MDTVTVGRRVRDSATSFTGVVTAQTEYLGRPSRLVLVERQAPDGSRVVSEWIDAGRLSYVNDAGEPV